MPQRLPRYLAAEGRADDLRKLAKILLETGAALDAVEPEWKPVNGAGGGEPARLRGLPAFGSNVTGAIPGTNPVAAPLAKERGRRR